MIRVFEPVLVDRVNVGDGENVGANAAAFLVVVHLQSMVNLHAGRLVVHGDDVNFDGVLSSMDTIGELEGAPVVEVLGVVVFVANLVVGQLQASEGINRFGRVKQIGT